MELHTLGVNGGYTQPTSSRWRAASPAGARRATPAIRRAGSSSTTRTATTTAARSCSACRSPPVAGSTTASTCCKILANHPSTARFVSRKLLRWLLNYDPSHDAGGRHRRRVHAHAAATSRPWYGASSLRERAVGAAALQASVALDRVGAARARRPTITNFNTIRGTYVSGSGNAPFAWGPPDGYPHQFEYWGGLPLPRWNYAFNLANNSVGGVTVDLTALLAGATTAAQIADRIDVLVFSGEMPAADKAALDCLPAAGPAVAVAHQGRIRSGACHRPASSGTEGRSSDIRSERASCRAIAIAITIRSTTPATSTSALSRREFVARTTATAVALSVPAWLPRVTYAQSAVGSRHPRVDLPARRLRRADAGAAVR